MKELHYIFDTDNLVCKLDKVLTDTPADIVCIDTFSDLYGGDMNQSNKVRTFLQDYHKLTQKHKCLIMFLHHTGKYKEDAAPNKNNFLGSQGFEAKMRLVIEFKSDIADTDFKHLCIVKGNYLPSTAKKESYVLHLTENMTFENTGDRVPLESLVKATNKDKERYERAKELHVQGFKFEEIAPMIGVKTKGTVSKIINGYEEKYGTSKTLKTEIQEDEQEFELEELHNELIQEEEA